MKRTLTPQPWLFPRPVALVTARGADGRDNIVTLSWVGVACSEPPMLTIAVRPSRFSHHLIAESREFVCNLPTADQMPVARFCGTNSGAEVEKFAALGLHRDPALKVGAPLIRECPVNLECVVKEVRSLGTHDQFLAEIVALHAREDLLTAAGTFNDHAFDALVYMSPDYFGLRPLEE